MRQDEFKLCEDDLFVFIFIFFFESMRA